MVSLFLYSTLNVEFYEGVLNRTLYCPMQLEFSKRTNVQIVNHEAMINSCMTLARDMIGAYFETKVWKKACCQNRLKSSRISTWNKCPVFKSAFNRIWKPTIQQAYLTVSSIKVKSHFSCTPRRQRRFLKDQKVPLTEMSVTKRPKVFLQKLRYPLFVHYQFSETIVFQNTERSHYENFRHCETIF